MARGTLALIIQSFRRTGDGHALRMKAIGAGARAHDQRAGQRIRVEAGGEAGQGFNCDRRPQRFGFQMPRSIPAAV